MAGMFMKSMAALDGSGDSDDQASYRSTSTAFTSDSASAASRQQQHQSTSPTYDFSLSGAGAGGAGSDTLNTGVLQSAEARKLKMEQLKNAKLAERQKKLLTSGSKYSVGFPHGPRL